MKDTERVFSPLNFIQIVVGDKAQRDLLELRSFFRWKNSLEDDCNVHGENAH